MIIRLLLTVVVSGAGATGAFAQHDAHQAAPSTAVDETLANCAQVQPVVQQLLDGASARLQAARLTNSATGLRAAVDDLDAALRDLRAELAPYAKVESTDAHAGHAMPAANPTPPPGKPATTKPLAATKSPADAQHGQTTLPESTGGRAQTNEAQKIEQW